MKIKVEIKKIIYVILLFIEILLAYLNIYPTICFVLILAFVTIEQIIRTKNNQFLFFMELSLAYFNFSVIISKYIGSGTSTGSSVWHQLMFDNTMGIGLSCMVIFITTLGLILNSNIKKLDSEIYKKQELNTSNSILLIICLIVTFVTFDYMFTNMIITNRKIYEYCIIFFVLGFYFAKNNKLFSIWLFIVMIISFLDNSSTGGRVVTLQPLIAWYYINYFEKINSKKMLLIVIVGILGMTAMGMYGDILDRRGDISVLNIQYVSEIFFNRKFTNDTSIMAYWAGLTVIETSNYFSIQSRLINFLEFMIPHSLFGSTIYSTYKLPISLSRVYYLHYNGGMLFSYFYYWLWYFGVAFIGTYVSKIFNKISKLKLESSDLYKIVCIYWISTLPRWYLYEPTTLFRGTLLIMLAYLIIKKVLMRRIKKEVIA